ncbi:MAG: hypothetical protein JWQ02_1875 [Capsulimonas sp.]|nr:hypothetical protein [Capsulimonas sp.]
MTRRHCQATVIAAWSVALFAFLSVALSPVNGTPPQAHDRAVETALQFFDALDNGDLETIEREASSDVVQYFMSFAQVRKQKFGSRWGGERSDREIVHVERDGQVGEIVTLRARYEAATLEQIAYVNCSSACRVMAYKEGPVGN